MQQGKNVKGACSSGTGFLHILYFCGDQALLSVLVKRREGANRGLNAAYLPSQFSAASFQKRSSPWVPLLLPTAPGEFEEKVGLLLCGFKLQEQKDLTLFPFYTSIFNYCFPHTL